MKKLTTILSCMLLAVTASAQIVTQTTTTTTRNDNTNLFEKIPEEGKYVGYAGIEIMSPGFFGDGGSAVGVTTTHGAMVRETIFVGAGTGYFADFHNKQGLIPIYGDIHYFFRSQYQRRIYPHIAGRLGAQIATQGGAGAFGQIAIGLRVPFSEKFAMNLEVGPYYGTHYEREHANNELSINGKPFKSSGAKFAFFGRVNFEF